METDFSKFEYGIQSTIANAEGYSKILSGYGFSQGTIECFREGYLKHNLEASTEFAEEDDTLHGKNYAENVCILIDLLRKRYGFLFGSLFAFVFAFRFPMIMRQHDSDDEPDGDDDDECDGDDSPPFFEVKK